MNQQENHLEQIGEQSVCSKESLTLGAIRSDIKRQGLEMSDPDLMKKVQSIFIADEEVSKLAPLRSLPQLRELKLWDTKISNEELYQLEDLEKLSCLELDGTVISDLNPIAKLKDLLTLSLNDTEVSDLSPLQKLPNLRKLDLSGCLKVKDIGPVASCSRLEQLFIDETSVSDILCLEGCKSLRLLVVTPDLVSEEQIDRLRALSPDLEIRP